MRTFRFLHLAILSVVLASATGLYAQDEKPEDAKPATKADPKAQAKPDEAKTQDDGKPAKTEQRDEKQKEKEKQAQDKSGDRMKPASQDHPEKQAGVAHPAGKGARIPEDKFRAHFGRSHTFAASGVIVEGQSQFQYGGYTVALVDPWPQGWAYTDTCYIDEIDGEYFLFDMLHPNVRIAVFFSA